jgi:hypothetical protein
MEVARATHVRRRRRQLPLAYSLRVRVLRPTSADRRQRVNPDMTAEVDSGSDGPLHGRHARGNYSSGNAERRLRCSSHVATIWTVDSSARTTGPTLGQVTDQFIRIHTPPRHLESESPERVRGFESLRFRWPTARRIVVGSLLARLTAPGRRAPTH